MTLADHRARVAEIVASLSLPVDLVRRDHGHRQLTLDDYLAAKERDAEHRLTAARQRARDRAAEALDTPAGGGGMVDAAGACHAAPPASRTHTRPTDRITNADR